MKFHVLVVPTLALAVTIVVAEYPQAAPVPLPPKVVPVPSQPEPPPQAETLIPIDNLAPYQIIEEPEGDDEGFIVQNGFEGYIVPEDFDPAKSDGSTSVLPALGFVTGLFKLPQLLFGLFPAFGNFLLLLLAGGAFTTAVCALTPFCTLPLPFRMDNFKEYAESDRAKFGIGFILDALEYYEQWYHKQDELTKSQKNEVGSTKNAKKRR